MNRYFPLLLLVGAVGLADTTACSSTDDPPPVVLGPIAHFHVTNAHAPDFLDVPFPSDAYLTNGHVMADLPGIETLYDESKKPFLTHELAKLDGFSRTAMAVFPVDDPTAKRDDDSMAVADIDPASLPKDEDACKADGSSVFLLDLEATDPAAARLTCRAIMHLDGIFSNARAPLAVGPARGVLLAEGHRYAAVLTSRVHDKKGRALGASSEFTKLVQSGTGAPYAALYKGAYDAAKQVLGTALGADTIIAIAPFTTQHATKELIALHDDLITRPVPALHWDAASLAPMGVAKFARAPGGVLPAGFTASLDAYLGVVDPAAKLPDGTDDPDVSLPVRAHDKIESIGTAAFDSINYLAEKGGYDQIDHRTVQVDGSGKFQTRTEKIWMTFSIPSSPMPSTGYPVVILLHGIGGSREILFSLANTFAAKGWATVVIDGITFGARAPEPQYQKDAHTDYEKAPGATYVGPDGIADTSNGKRNDAIDFFGTLQNLGALRDQFKQAALDLVQVTSIINAKPDLSSLATGATVPVLDPTRVAYVGISLGGIEGALFASIEPRVQHFYLSVTGGGVVSELATHGPSVYFQLAGAAGLNFGIRGDYMSESHPLVSVMQTIVDGGDPLNFASLLLHPTVGNGGAVAAPKNVIQTEVLYDELVSNESGEAFARAAGFGLAVPNVGSNAGILDPKNLNSRLWPVPLANANPDADGAIHDFPMTGSTAVVVQVSPGQHGEESINRKAKRSYAIPYAAWTTDTPFTRFDDPQKFEVPCPYRELQTMMTTFFEDGFSGKVPRVKGFVVPKRDLDNDGTPDDVDPNPADPKVK